MEEYTVVKKYTLFEKLETKVFISRYKYKYIKYKFGTFFRPLNNFHLDIKTTIYMVRYESKGDICWFIGYKHDNGDIIKDERLEKDSDIFKEYETKYQRISKINKILN